MDFAHNQILDGRAFRGLTVIDQRSRESVPLEVNLPPTGRCVDMALDEAAIERGWPQVIRVDNGTEFTSKALDEWAWRRGAMLDYTRPANPTENGLIESFNGRLRDEFLNVSEFITMQDAREQPKSWQHDFKHHRPNSSLGHLAPSKFIRNRSDQQPESVPTPAQE